MEVFKEENHGICLGDPRHWILLVEMFPVVYGTPQEASWFERYSSLKVKTPISGLKSQGMVTWHLIIKLRAFYLGLRINHCVNVLKM